MGWYEGPVTQRRLQAARLDFDALRAELALPTAFPPEAQREADEAAEAVAERRAKRDDLTEIPFVTIDPATSRDLDQAMCLQRRPAGGYRVYYAIADVAAFVRPGGPLEAETWRRGQTVYLPDGNIPLHPHALSEGAASLLPDLTRPAVVWTVDLDADGVETDVVVRRAIVRSRAKLDYAGVQRDVAADRLAEPIALLPELGRLLIARGLARGGINLPMPEQEIEPDGDGWRLILRAPEPVEEYNAQISLLTGIAAARMMLTGGVGLLRTMPAPEPSAIAGLRAAAAALRITWPPGTTVGELIADLDPGRPQAAALLDEAAELLRGAGYTAFDGAVPAEPGHGAVAAPYAHVTAPLRRLADRYATETCLALFEAQEIPPWVRAALPRLPEVMAATDRMAGAATRGAIDLAEAVLLQGRVGEEFDAAVLDVTPGRGDRPSTAAIALDDPPVRAKCRGNGLRAGERQRVRLVEADPVKRRVRFEPA
jgi:VacB/RNase II family 3'-5' exoribonuclease